MALRAEQKDETRARILRAALDLFGRDGTQVRMKDIADAASVAVGSLFVHFGSRAGLLQAVGSTALDELAELVPAPGQATTTAALKALLDANRTPVARAMWRAGDELAWASPHATEVVPGVIRNFVREHLVREGRPPKDADAIADLLSPGLLMTARRLAVNEAPESVAQAFLRSTRALLQRW